MHGKSNKCHKHDNLESQLQDQSSGAQAVSLEHLKKITNNFSDERLLGKGGTGFVYKGVEQSGEIVAVKRLMPSMVGAQSLFENEVHHLMRLRHPNIVRLMGYCYETKRVILEYRGKNVFAERSEMLLCLEYLPKGSLDVYISDGSSQHDWRTCYKIIEGICNGLHYLHEQIDKSVLHLDLKPANVLLDDNLAPKLTDFGLSRLLDQYQTMFTPSRVGTLGYMAPEYIHEGTVTPKSDIFSLGVIIMELITGHRDYPRVVGTSSEGFIELALKKWRNTLEKAQGYTKLEIDCQQIKRCIQIGLICVNPEWTKRPTTTKIIKMLKGTESSDYRISNEATSSAYQTSYGATEEGKPPAKNTLCIEILEQAERRDPASVSLAIAGDCLRGKLKLVYLKNGEGISPQTSIVCITVPGTPAGADLHVDPYMLSVRSPYLRAVFARHNHQCGAARDDAEGDRMELQELLSKEVEVEYDALLLVLVYLYSNRVGDLPEWAYICADEDGCVHLGCHPTISFKVQVLFTAFTFQVPELTSFFQRDLLNILHKVEVDNLLLILYVANLCKKSCVRLLERCLEMVVRSNLDMITLEKSLPPDVVKQSTDSRLSLGLVSPEDMGFPKKHVRRILRALDCDDLELVRMLLREGQANLDDAFALHYAVEHCGSEITTELLEMALADVNLRNPRGYTVLHIAARRRDPKIVASLLTKGARPSDRTTDGRKSVQISKRLTKHADYFRSTEEGRPTPNDRLCIEILEQAEKRDAQASIHTLHRLSDNLAAAFRSPEDFAFLADACVAVPGAPDLRVHRCVLSARSPFLRAFFKRRAAAGGAEGNRVELREHLGDEVEVGYEALQLVLDYLYSGRVRDLPKSACACVDEGGCAHVGCHPAVSFMAQVLFAASTFQVRELANLFQRHLLDSLDKVEVDNLPLVLSVANLCNKSCGKLFKRCLEIVVRSDLDMITLDKALPLDVIKQIIDSRITLGLASPEDNGFPNKHVRKILSALDSDDVELVRLLLKEGKTNLDDAFALHYAVEHCDSKITTELLDIALADVNLKNPRGYTVLHIAARRRDPKIVVPLLTKGARPSDFTFDGRKAVQIAKRLTKQGDYFGNTEEGKPSPNDKLCIEVLEQAKRRDPQLGEASVSLALAGDCLRGKLLYLENRVALARIMFPIEARVAMDIAQVDGTLEFTLGSCPNPPPEITTVDLNDTPFKMKDEHLARMRALSKTVELGKRFFPRCSNVLDKIMDDEPELASLGRDASSERKRRFHDLQDMLLKAFSEDREEFARTTTLSASSSSTPTVARNLSGRPRR